MKAFEEGLIVNPSEDWEFEHYDEKLPDKKGIKPILTYQESKVLHTIFLISL